VSAKNKNGILDLDQSIIKILSDERPKTVKQLIKLVQLKNDMPEQEIMKRILLLQDQKKIVLRDQLPNSFTLKSYLLSIHAYWYLIIVALAATTSTIILANLENAPIIGNIFVYARYLLGSIFVLFLPGYSFIKALFPVKEIDNVERAALSVGMSLAIVAINALILNYTPWGIRTTPITLSLLALTTIFATAAIIREHQAKTKQTNNTPKTHLTNNNQHRSKSSVRIKGD
jgi:uncharacterized membrane protein